MSFMPHPFPPPPMVPPPTKTTIKLALEGPGAEKEGPFVRIEVSNNVGPQILKTLRDRSLELWRMKNGATEQNIDGAKVFLTYRDAENDCCLIFSEDDLRCALPNYPSSLRVFARVEIPKHSTPTSAPTPPSVPAPTPPSVPAPTPPSVPAPNRNTSTQTNNDRSFSDIPVHKVVEAVVGILTAAAVALQKHVRADTQVSTTPPASAAAVTFAPVAVTRAVAAAVTSVEEAPPFIHGRHTCDGCLATPIVGKRFHAASLPDYDLCSACKDNYKGDIKFEEAELDRDRAFQERWRRRFEKWEQEQEKKKEQQKKAERMNARHVGRSQPSFASPGPRRCGGSRWTHNNTTTICPIPHPEKPTRPPEQVDHALKEAIRRSMLDIQQGSKKENTEEKKKEGGNLFAAPAEPAPPTFEEHEQFNSKPSSEKEVTASAFKEKTVIPAPVPKKKETMIPPAPKEEESTIPPTVPKKEETVIPPVPKEEKSVIPPAAPVPKKEESVIPPVPKEEKSVIPPAVPVPKKEESLIPPIPEEEKSVIPPAAPVPKKEETVIPPAPKEEEFVIPPAAPVGAHPAPKKDKIKSPAKEADDSFTDDAEGNGDVAAALGETMDAIANAINDINAELVRNYDVDDVSETSEVVVMDFEDETSDAIFQDKEEKFESETKKGATILSGEEDKEDDVSHNSWDIVGDQNGMSDEALARAAQVIGSALFESEIKSRSGATNASVPMLGSDHSIPSTLPSLGPNCYGLPHPAQTQHWWLQLEQLHELGFNNDNVTIDIMERLEAANISLGKTEEVSVERVVNELLKNW